MGEVMRKVILPLLCVAALVGSPLIASAQEGDVWRHGIVQPKGDAGFSYMAVDGKFAEKNKVKLEILPMQGDTLLLKSLIGGALDSYEGGLGSPMIAASKGANIRIIGCHWQKFTYALYSKPEFNKVEDLKGKTIGVSAPGSQPDLFVKALLIKAGLDAKTDVHFALVGSDSQRIQALSNGIVDAAAASDEFQLAAQKFGLKLLVHATEALPKATHRCIYTTAEKLKQNPDLITRFLASEISAFRYALDNRDKTLALALKRAQSPNQKEAEFLFDNVIREHVIDRDFQIYPDKLTWMRDLLVTNGFLDKGFDPASIVDKTALTKAQALVK
jgi:NitT/TauT family transport system substrate-binding protein